MPTEVAPPKENSCPPPEKSLSTFPQWFHNLPCTTRHNFWRETIAILPFSVVMGIMTHNYCAFVARKALQMPDSLLAVLMSCHMLGLLLAGPLVGLLHQGQKNILVARIAALLSLCLLVLGLLPYSAWSPTVGGVIFLIFIFLAQTGIAQIATLRSSMWRLNFPAEHRGKLVVANMLSATIVGTLAVVLFSHLMDRWGWSFRYLYLISSMCGLLGAWLFTRIDVGGPDSTGNGTTETSKRYRLLAGLSVLKQDGRFRYYMSWMMLHGFATLVVEIVLVIIITDQFPSTWIIGGLAFAAIPLFATGLSSLIWARYFDRHRVFTIRFFSGSTWALARVTLMIALWQESIALVLVSRLISGIAMGGGQLAWRLGHMEFAPKDQDALYMGTHVSLTGIRGIIAPFCGIALYQLMGAMWLFGITAAIQFACSIAFYLMPRFLNMDLKRPAVSR